MGFKKAVMRKLSEISKKLDALTENKVADSLTKAEIMEQLDDSGVEYSPKQTKAELLSLLKGN